jgi:hypothetical protein
MKVLERDISKKWIAAHLKLHPGDYAYRIIDTPWGGAKPFDWFLFCGNMTFAIEFKVDRRKKFKYSISEIMPHQRSELLKFHNGKERMSKVIVYHPDSDQWFEIEVK